ncbi:MAG: hypothetical protein AAFR46_18140 [Pseudomonadota bacterium]
MFPVISGFFQLPSPPKHRQVEEATADDGSATVVPLETASAGRDEGALGIGAAIRSFAENLFAALVSARPRLVTVSITAPGYGAYNEQRMINGSSFSVAVRDAEMPQGAADEMTMRMQDAVPAQPSTRGALLDRRV